MKIVNRRRDIEAAHSGITEFKIQSTEDARKQLDEDVMNLGNELIHMLQHTSDIESKMADELNSIVRANVPRVRIVMKPPILNSRDSRKE